MGANSDEVEVEFPVVDTEVEEEEMEIPDMDTEGNADIPWVDFEGQEPPPQQVCQEDPAQIVDINDLNIPQDPSLITPEVHDPNIPQDPSLIAPEVHTDTDGPTQVSTLAT